MLENPSFSPIPVMDSDFLIEEVDTFLVPEDSIPSGIESDLDSEGDNVFLDNLLNEDLIPEYDRFTFDIEPDAPVINNFDELNEDECFDPGGGEIVVSQNVEEDDSFAFVIRIFLPYRTYPMDSPLLLSIRTTEIRQFLGLAGYYRRFIKNFSKIAKSLTELTQKNKKYICGKDQESAFQLLKQKLREALILALPEGNDNFVVYCDASHQGLGAVETDIQEKDEKQSKNIQNRARNGKDKVKSKPKSVKVKKSTGKSTPTKSKVNQMKKIQLEGLKLPNLKLYYENKRQGLKLHTG
ncbi:putative reverse transcriptase domain-containing protein [Tanacetum coccineum]